MRKAKCISEAHDLVVGEEYELLGHYMLGDGEYGYYLKGKPQTSVYYYKLFELIEEKDEVLDTDNIPCLSVSDVYEFMCNSGAYMPYNRPTHQMLRDLAKSKVVVYK